MHIELRFKMESSDDEIISEKDGYRVILSGNRTIIQPDTDSEDEQPGKIAL